MTEQKSFKRLVRARMERTGESYTTARRHVLKDARPTGQMHDSWLLREMLDDEWSEAMLAGLGGGIGFMYFVFEYKGHTPTMTIVARHHPAPFIPTALAHANIAHDVTSTTSARKAEKQLRDVDGPVICLLGKEKHPVGVLGTDGDTVTVHNHGTNVQPLGEFMASWGQGRHEMISIGERTGEPDVAAAVKMTCEHLTGPVLGNNFDVNFGFSGMRKLAEQLRDKGKKGWGRRWADDPGFVKQRLRDCLEVEFTAPAATRPLYAEFLEEAGLPGAQEFRASGALWSEIANGGDYDDLAGKVDEARSIEERAIRLLML
ncbi:BtrH N-terminal domain-containing protein [Lentzea sp. NBC_00516]|uniref:BtrH N-terminal domain-containing protein n=1 Tax=Lentzea sp. NBC_00516 TaxID=2903582 RepID=UPI002E7FF9B7|nr:BtrH N-terminal domain-containing protein [Lentzea sp. NBC_00516]WUD22556.1 BtrH N-terminal domain-containing protein [Lentzea sp. NBC_00516]